MSLEILQVYIKRIWNIPNKEEDLQENCKNIWIQVGIVLDFCRHKRDSQICTWGEGNTVFQNCRVMLSAEASHILIIPLFTKFMEHHTLQYRVLLYQKSARISDVKSLRKFNSVGSSLLAPGFLSYIPLDLLHLHHHDSRRISTEKIFLNLLKVFYEKRCQIEK